MIPIYFYLPPHEWPTSFPEHENDYWIGFRRGLYCWTLKTYLHLKTHNFPCELVNTIPPEGIIIAHWDVLPADLQPTAKQLFICIQADRSRHAYAQIHILQNPYGCRAELGILGDRLFLPGHNYYIPHWTQPGLIPRHPSRGSRFENIAFFGLTLNIEPFLKTAAWDQQLADLGLNWQIISNFEKWNDYSEVDGVVAVRGFGQQGYHWKPATKLYNAWLAGVPAILGCESAFQMERRSPLDYIEVKSPQEILASLERLRNDPTLREKMVENGYKRAEEVTPNAITQKWINFLTDVAQPVYESWVNYPVWQRQLFLKRRTWAIQTRDARKQLQKIRNMMGLRSRLRGLLKPQN